MIQPTRAGNPGEPDPADPEAAIMHQTASALRAVAQTVESLRNRTEDAANEGEGSISSLKSRMRLLAYLTRGCDTFRVAICEGILGRDPF